MKRRRQPPCSDSSSVARTRSWETSNAAGRAGVGAVLELVREDISLIPLSIGAFAMSIAMLLETRTS